MNDDTMARDHAQHPEDLLADYVDGSASGEDRVAAEALVASCSECRREVELSVQARAALMTLPELDAPGLVDSRVPEPAADGGNRVTALLGRVRQWGWEQVAWGAGIIAAGSLVALFVLVQSGGEPSRQTLTRGAPQAGKSLEALEHGGPQYTPASLDDLARRLVATQRATLASGGDQTTPAPLSKANALPPEAFRRATDCLRSGGGLRRRARLVHLEQASFQGTSAFIGGFRQTVRRGAPHYLILLAVDRKTCSALYVINRSL